MASLNTCIYPNPKNILNHLTDSQLEFETRASEERDDITAKKTPNSEMSIHNLVMILF